MFEFFNNVEGTYIVENGVKIHVEDYDFEAYFRGKGWLSPDDQHPFCMESAREKGYEFETNTLYIVYENYEKLVEGELDDTETVRCLDFMRGWAVKQSLNNIDWFMPYNNPRETARLVELGVKRYEKVGE